MYKKGNPLLLKSEQKKVNVSTWLQNIVWVFSTQSTQPFKDEKQISARWILNPKQYSAVTLVYLPVSLIYLLCDLPT